MTAGLNSAVAWSYGLAGFGSLLLALRFLLTQERASTPGRVMLWASGWTAGWGLLTLAFTQWPSPELLAFGAMCDVLSYGGWFLVLHLLRPQALSGPRDARARWLVPLGFAVVAWGVLAHVGVLVGSDAVASRAARLAQYDSLAAAVLGLVLVEQVFRNTTRESHWAITHLLVGLGAVFAFDVFTYADALLFSSIDPDVWAVRGFVRTLALVLVVVSLTRAKGSRFNIVVSRQVMFRSAALAICGLYLLFMSAAGYYVRYFGGSWGRALQVAVVSAALILLVVLLFSGSMRAKLRVTISKHFFPYRYDYREEWLRFTQALSSSDQQVATGQQVIRGLADLVESPAGALWIRDAEGKLFVPAATWNMPTGEPEDAMSSLAQFLRSTGWVINLEEFRSSPRKYGELDLPPWLSRIPNAWLIVPLTIRAELTGFVVLATARTVVYVDWEVNDLLKTAARQAASFLGHIQANDALLEARKFEAFNRLSAFVVHDLKNIVSQLSLMLRNAERHQENPEFRRDMLMTVGHAVERMKQLMMQLREGTTPLDVTHRVDVAEIAQRVQRGKFGQMPKVELQLDEPCITRAHPERLERVIGHLVQNAIDATEPSGTIWIRTARDNGEAMIEVGDTGHGMTPEFVRERLFKPFQTTKTTGMGIGAYESHQYVRELGGRVVVESTPGVGTRIRLYLPMFEPALAEAPLRDVA